MPSPPKPLTTRTALTHAVALQHFGEPAQTTQDKSWATYRALALISELSKMGFEIRAIKKRPAKSAKKRKA